MKKQNKTKQNKKKEKKRKNRESDKPSDMKMYYHFLTNQWVINKQMLWMM